MELIPRAASRLASPQWQFRDAWWFGGASILKHDAIHIYMYIYIYIMEIYLDRLIMFSEIPGRLFDISGCFFMVIARRQITREPVKPGLIDHGVPLSKQRHLLFRGGLTLSGWWFQT